VRRPGPRRPTVVGGLVGLAVAGLLLTGCGPGPLATSAGTNTSGTPATTTPGVTLSTEPTGPSSDPRIVTTGSGHTLYDFTLDTPTTSGCTSSTCTYVWPPLTVTGTPTVGPGLKASLVGTIRRPDGTMQVTYGGHPLYTYVSDTTPGDVSGQGITQSGGQWYVVAPDGRQITTAFSVSASPGQPDQG